MGVFGGRTIDDERRTRIVLQEIGKADGRNRGRHGEQVLEIKLEIDALTRLASSLETQNEGIFQTDSFRGSTMSVIFCVRASCWSDCHGKHFLSRQKAEDIA